MNKEQKIKQLPKDWKWVKLEDVGKIETGTTPSKGNEAYYGKEIPFFKPTDLQQGINTIAASDNLSKLGFEKTRKLPKNSILVTCIGATIGKTGLIRVEGASNQQINSIIPDKQHCPKFVYYQVISHRFQKQIKDNSSSTTLPILNKSKFQQLDFITTSFDLQQSIVSKIEKLFSELDKGIENLRLAQQQLKTYRQAVLKWAFEGRFSKSIEKWKNMTMKEVAEKIVVGYVGPVTEHIVQTGGTKFLSTTHIGENEFLNHDIREVSTVFNEKNKKSQVIPGDIIIARHGDSGKSCIIPDWIKTAQVSNAVILRPNPQIVSSKFICYRLNAERQRMQKMKVGGVFQVVNTKSMESFETLVPPIQEQHRIVQEIENRLSVADKMDESINQSLQQTELLRQSLLKMAFEGRLNY